MTRDDLSYLANRKPGAQRLVTFHHSDGEEFGIGTVEEFAALMAAGIIDPTATTRIVSE